MPQICNRAVCHHAEHIIIDRTLCLTAHPGRADFIQLPIEITAVSVRTNGRRQGSAAAGAGNKDPVSIAHDTVVMAKIADHSLGVRHGNR